MKKNQFFFVIFHFKRIVVTFLGMNKLWITFEHVQTYFFVSFDFIYHVSVYHINAFC